MENDKKFLKLKDIMDLKDKYKTSTALCIEAEIFPHIDDKIQKKVFQKVDNKLDK